MATATKTYNFTGSAEGWTGTATVGTPTLSYDGTNNRLSYVGTVGRNKTDQGYFSISGTFETIFGITADATVNGYSAASFNGGCTVFNVVDYFYEGDIGGNGALSINDGTLRILIDDQSTYTAASQTHSPSVNPNITGLSLPATTSITIYLYLTSDNGNNASANVEGYVDDISITIDYTAASEPTTTTTTQGPTTTTTTQGPTTTTTTHGPTTTTTTQGPTTTTTHGPTTTTTTQGPTTTTTQGPTTTTTTHGPTTTTTTHGPTTTTTHGPTTTTSTHGPTTTTTTHGPTTTTTTHGPTTTTTTHGPTTTTTVASFGDIAGIGFKRSKVLSDDSLQTLINQMRRKAGLPENATLTANLAWLDSINNWYSRGKT